MKILIRLKDSIIAGLIISIIVIIVVPMSTAILDFLLIINITFSLILLLSALYVDSPLELSSFPSLLLVATLFRLSLNISSTRLILGNGGNAGNVIKTFGSFVIGSNPVVGLIIFLIIIVIQFIVITKGAERVSEVAARFTLDAMPGKQMAIDADLNAGLINEQQAKERREEIQRSADFYGAMDGASKFVKGDAVAGIIITLINLIGGIVIGLVISGQAFSEVVDIYTLATVGDGLVSQIPALLISTAAGIVLTRSGSKLNLNTEILKQLFSRYNVMLITGLSLLGLTFVPGLPKIPLIFIGSSLLIFGYKIYSTFQVEQEQVQESKIQKAKKQEDDYEITDYIFTDPIVIEFGYNLVSFVDRQKGGKLLDRLVMIRRQIAMEMGVIVPKIRVKDNPNLMPNEYVINIKGNKISEGEVLSDYYLAMNPEDSDEKLEGIETREPAFGMPAYWIEEGEVDKAEMKGFTVIDPISVIATHISEVIKGNSHELLGREEVKDLVDTLKDKYPALVNDVVPEIISMGALQKVLKNLLQEGLKIKSLPTILEILGDYGKTVPELDELTEYVRQGLKKEISAKYAYENRLEILMISPNLEQRISQTVTNSGENPENTLKPQEIQKFTENTIKEYNQSLEEGNNPVLVTTPVLRRHIRNLIKQNGKDLDVMSVSEIDSKYDIEVVGSISI
ncbi:MAG: flagellar biosynthesis protein FlhA [Bacillota bacterium]|nr:flagellar biosynthesis protein FlhA [Bacillota bacterium]